MGIIYWRQNFTTLKINEPTKLQLTKIREMKSRSIVGTTTALELNGCCWRPLIRSLTGLCSLCGATAVSLDILHEYRDIDVSIFAEWVADDWLCSYSSKTASERHWRAVSWETWYSSTIERHWDEYSSSSSSSSGPISCESTHAVKWNGYCCELHQAWRFFHLSSLLVAWQLDNCRADNHANSTHTMPGYRPVCRF